MKTWVALLRGINVGGHNKIAMATLRAGAESLGFLSVKSYIQSGNLVFKTATQTRAVDLEHALEDWIQDHCQLQIPVLVRSAALWKKFRTARPFADLPEDHDKRLCLGLCKGPLPKTLTRDLEDYARADEKIVLTSGAFWLYAPNGLARTKLSPQVLDRACGAPVTLRNKRSVDKISALLES